MYNEFYIGLSIVLLFFVYGNQVAFFNIFGEK